ncbi:protoglobin domain-containing protein [Halobacillus andaensis]|uniref:protoglobin domain-containing protein n=1 Tax=Halobacillus andaensis TaxID=1176239 RepID=UPI003D709F08
MFPLFATKTKSKPAPLVFEPVPRGKINIEKGSTLHKQFQMIALTEEDLSVLKSLQPIVRRNIAVIVDQFYENLAHEGSLIEIIKDNSSIERLKKTLRAHIQEMFNGLIDEQFIHKRKSYSRGACENWSKAYVVYVLLSGYIKLSSFYL